MATIAVRSRHRGVRVSSMKTGGKMQDKNKVSWEKVKETMAKSLVVAATAVVSVVGVPDAAMADLRLPPIDKDPNRCERAFIGNTIGQSNAVSDRVLDLRYCELPGADLHGTTSSVYGGDVHRTCE